MGSGAVPRHAGTRLAAAGAHHGSQFCQRILPDDVRLRERTAMRAMTGAVSAALAALAITACGGSSASASAACRDFAAWYHSTGNNPGSGENDAMLRKAVSEAPRGPLYQDMSTVQSLAQSTAELKKVVKPGSGGLWQVEEELAVSAARDAEHACQSGTLEKPLGGSRASRP